MNDAKTEGAKPLHERIAEYLDGDAWVGDCPGCALLTEAAAALAPVPAREMSTWDANGNPTTWHNAALSWTDVKTEGAKPPDAAEVERIIDLFAKRTTTNAPHPHQAGHRIIGWVVPSDELHELGAAAGHPRTLIAALRAGLSLQAENARLKSDETPFHAHTIDVWCRWLRELSGYAPRRPDIADLIEWSVARVDRLQAENASLAVDVCLYRQKAQRFEAENARLREALVKLRECATHYSSCTYWQTDTSPCSCGVDAALAASEPLTGGRETYTAEVEIKTYGDAKKRGLA